MNWIVFFTVCFGVPMGAVGIGLLSRWLESNTRLPFGAIFGILIWLVFSIIAGLVAET